MNVVIKDAYGDELLLEVEELEILDAIRAITENTLINWNEVSEVTVNA